MNLEKKALALHKKAHGKIALLVKTPIVSKEDLSCAYTPGVAFVSKKIAKSKDQVWKYTSRGNWVAVVTDGTAVLGLGDIGPEAALPVMEGKAVLFKEFADVDAFPICLSTKDPDEIVETIIRISTSFAGINLEDISAPRCFYIEEKLKKLLPIPVFHDDQHGAAIVVLAALINSAKLADKKINSMAVTISGAGAAGVAIAKFLISQGIKDIILVDSEGILSEKRKNLNPIKQDLVKITNKEGRTGSLGEALVGRDVFIGVSKGNILTEKMIGSMKEKPIIFALANPDPEILPEKAKRAGAFIVATGRSDYANQINNVLAFPGIFRGALDIRAKKITKKMKLAAAFALSDMVRNPTPEKILPEPLDKMVAKRVAEAIKKAVVGK